MVEKKTPVSNLSPPQQDSNKGGKILPTTPPKDHHEIPHVWAIKNTSNPIQYHLYWLVENGCLSSEKTWILGDVAPPSLKLQDHNPNPSLLDKAWMHISRSSPTIPLQVMVKSYLLVSLWFWILKLPVISHSYHSYDGYIYNYKVRWSMMISSDRIRLTYSTFNIMSLQCRKPSSSIPQSSPYHKIMGGIKHVPSGKLTHRTRGLPEGQTPSASPAIRGPIFLSGF